MIDALYTGPGERLGKIDYEEFIAKGDPDFKWSPPANESSAIALNYTSGTTGNPKGVVYHHRGTFLEAAGNVMSWPMPAKPVYLWTLPMFHCNGWCFPWSVTAMGGTHVCLRKVDPAVIFPMIVEHGVTHMCGAPTVLGLLTSAPAEQRRRFNHTVDIQTGGSPPPAKIIKAMEELGFRVTHIYGMTELQGPSTLCVPQDGWEALPLEERAALTARQGVRYAVVEGQMVADSAQHEAGAARRKDNGRDHDPRQHGDARLSEGSEGHRRRVPRRVDAYRRPRGRASRRLCRDQGSRQGHHHFRAARMSRASRSRSRSTSIPRCSLRRWLRGRTRNGAKRLAPSCS